MTVLADATAAAGFAGLTPAEACGADRCRAQGSVALVAACCHTTVTVCEVHFDANGAVPHVCDCGHAGVGACWVVCSDGIVG